MADAGTALIAIVGAGSGSVLWQGIKFLSDELARHRADRAAAKRLPLEQRSLEQRLAAEAISIQQEAMTTLRLENAELRTRLTEAQAVARDRDGQIRDLGVVIGRQEVELQRYRSGPASP